jgi:hypothetical protein
LEHAVSFVLSVFLLAGFFMTVTLKQAHAYLDLGSGSFIVQIVLASLFASLFAIKVFWKRLAGQVLRFLTKVKGVKGPR